MKFYMSLVVYLLIGLVLGWGILLMTKGSPWLLVVAALTYVISFAKIGCKTH